MNLPDFTQFEPLIRLKEQMGIPLDHYGGFPQTSHKPRAWILLKSGCRLDLLDPQPDAWTDKDLAIGISRTYRWGGYSKWDLPLSVAQHSLAVLALREAEGPLTAREALREILHDATEPLMGGFDPIASIKPHLGPEFQQLDLRIRQCRRSHGDVPLGRRRRPQIGSSKLSPPAHDSRRQAPDRDCRSNPGL